MEASLPADTRIAFVVSRFNEEITDGLLSGGRQVLRDAGVADTHAEVFRVPGAWEIPLVADQLARHNSSRQHKWSAIVCLGCVIRGQTSHDQHINRFVSMALGELGLKHQMPITFGILTVENRQQAIERSGGSVANRGAEATHAALDLLRTLASIRADSAR